MTPERLGAVLGEAPVPHGTWTDEAVFRAAAGAHPGARPDEIASRLRALPGVTSVQVQPNGFLLIAVTEPGELVTALPLIPPAGVSTPPSPATWDNPGFVIRFAYARASAVQRWAKELGVPAQPFRPELLDGPYDRGVLRALAELPSRIGSRRPQWPTYTHDLALAYHDAHEHAQAIPRGDEPITATHTARVRLAAAVHEVLAALCAGPLPERI